MKWENGNQHINFFFFFEKDVNNLEFALIGKTPQNSKNTNLIFIFTYNNHIEAVAHMQNLFIITKQQVIIIQLCRTKWTN